MGVNADGWVLLLLLSSPHGGLVRWAHPLRYSFPLCSCISLAVLGMAGLLAGLALVFRVASALLQWC